MTLSLPAPRRLLLALGVLFVAGKGAQTFKRVVLHLLVNSKPAPVPPLRLFSDFLRDLQQHKVQKVLLATSFCLVEAKDAAQTYRYS